MSEKRKWSGVQCVIVGASSLTVIVLFIAAPYCVYIYPEFFIPEGSEEWGGGATRNLLFAIGGLLGFLGLCLGAWRTIDFSKQVTLGQEQQFSETLSRGVELCAKSEEGEAFTRVSGVRILANLAESQPQNDAKRKIIYQTLYDFILYRAAMSEEPSPQDKESLRGDKFMDAARPDIEAAIISLGDLVPKDKKSREDFFGFIGLDFRYLDLRGANLLGAILEGANLSSTELMNADLSYSSLIYADLSGAELERVDLSNARLGDANLSNINLSEANLSDASLLKANLSSSILGDADLSGAELEGAKLSDAFLWGANLSGAFLKDADLSGADLSDTDLSNVKKLTQEQLNKCIYDRKNLPKNLPEGLVLPTDRAYKSEDDDMCFVESGNNLPDLE